MLRKIGILPLVYLFIFLACPASAQTLIVQGTTIMPADTAVKSELLNSLYGLLAQKEKPNKDNKYILPEALPETSALVDEMKGMEKSATRNDNNFYKCYLTNVVVLNHNNFLVQLAYIGTAENIPTLRANFRLLAHRENGRFLFSSPLKRNTAGWKNKKSGNIVFYYKDTINKADMKAYQKAVTFYDKKLNAPENPIEFYYCDNFPEVQHVLGIDYKLDFNGQKYNNTTANENHITLMVNGWNDSKHRFDPHDLWHERLRLVLSSDVINRPVDEGCAYLYGGSWGYTWPEVWAKFKKYADANPNADWLKLYMDVTNFEAGEKPLKVAYVLNALIVQQIEKEKGFAAVMPLLNCGPKEKGDDNYFRALQKITGIDKAGFNAAMWKLIREEK